VKAQEQRAREMNEDSNQLIEHYNVVKRACKMLYGEKSVKKVEDHDQGSHSSEDALNSINNSPNQGAANHEIQLNSEIRIGNEAGISMCYVAGTI